MGTRQEPFLDDVHLGPRTGLSRVVHRPVKSPSNPLWPDLPESSINHNFGYVSALYEDGRTKLWHSTWPEVPVGQPLVAASTGYAYADDAAGVVIQRPNLGLFSYNGNTNNNLVRPSYYILGHVYKYPQLGARPYIMIGRNIPPYGYTTTTIFDSADGLNFALVHEMPNPGTSVEPWALIPQADGKWVIYFQAYDPAATVRSLGMYRSSGTSLAGPWSIVRGYTNPVIPGTFDRQIYHVGGWVDGDTIYVTAGLFDGTRPPVPPYATWDDRIYGIALYVGRTSDPTTLTLVDESWLMSSNVPGDFDQSEIITGNQPAFVPHTVTPSGKPEWRMYYGGDTNPHHTDDIGVAEGKRLAGLATVQHRRIGGVTGDGEQPMERFTAANGATRMTMNSSGTVLVELRDPLTGLPIPGYAYADCDPITGDVFDYQVSWNGNQQAPADVVPYLRVTGTAFYAELIDATPADFAVGRSLSIPWLVKEAVGHSLSINWEVSNLTVVGRSLVARWDTHQAVGSSIDVRWSILNSVGRKVLLRWNTTRPEISYQTLRQLRPVEASYQMLRQLAPIPFAKYQTMRRLRNREREPEEFAMPVRIPPHNKVHS